MTPARAIGMALALVLVLGACGADPERSWTASEVEGYKVDDLTVWVGPITSLHPHEAPGHLVAALFSPLVTSDPATSLPVWGDDAPGALLADITTTDLRSWQLTIKEGWTWHDGTPVVAADLERGLRQAMQDGQPLVSTVSEARATGDRTLSLGLTAPFGQLPHLLTAAAFLPLPLLADTAPSRFAAAPVGTGPYQVAGRTGDIYLLEVAAAHPLADEVQQDRLRAQVSDQPGMAADVAIGGDGQPLPAGPDGGVPRDEVLRPPGRQLAYLGLPLTDARFADPDVRRALALAVDTSGIASEVLDDEVVPADRLIGPGLARSDGVTCAPCTPDPEAAADLWPDDLEGPLTLWYAADGGHEPVIDAIAGAWVQVLDVDDLQLATLPAAELIATLVRNEVTGPFRLSWQADISSPSRVLDPLFGPRGSANDVRYRSEEAADLLAAAALEPDLAAALDLYGQAEQAILDDLPVIPLWFSTIPIAARPDVTGIQMDGEGRLDWTTLDR